MDDLSRQVASNTQDLNNGQRRAFNVRINGEEHSATSRSGVANIYFPIDGQLMEVAECAFKLIINDGEDGGGGSGGDPCKNWNWGTKTYATFHDWLQRYPIGSQVDVDCWASCQCWDYASAFWRAQVNRNLLTACSDERDRDEWFSGKALGTWVSSCARSANAVGFTLVTQWQDIQAGDWVVWGSYDNTYTGAGHIAMAMARPTNISGASTVLTWGQNGVGMAGSPVQASNLYREGGTYGDFLGAFRYNDPTWLASLPKI